ADDDLVVLGVERARDRALELGLVVLGVGNAQREGVEPLALGALAERGEQRAVEAAREIAADGNIGAQHAQRGGPPERGAGGVRGVGDRAGEAWRKVVLGERA